MGLLANILTGVLKKTKQATANKYKKIGLGWLQVRRLKNLPETGFHTIPFMGGTLRFYNRYELIHSIDDIFLGNIYKINFPAGHKPLIIDCGANIGLSVIYFKKQYPGAKVIAFEPDSTNFDLLTANVASQHLQDVALHKQAVWTANTQLQFYNEGSMSSRIGDAVTNSGVESHSMVNVDATRLYDWLAGPVDLLKIDIEGAEYAVIKDIESRLHLVQYLFLEYHGLFSENHKLEEMLALIRRNGFSYYISEAYPIYPTPFYRENEVRRYDVQLNIYAFRP